MGADRGGGGLMGGAFPSLRDIARTCRALCVTPLDLLTAGSGGWDAALLRSELLVEHGVRRRRFIAEHVVKGGVGAELGVFTGLFSAVLLDVARPRQAYFVDPWWSAFGDLYPDWGPYTDYGRLRTKVAHDAAAKRIAAHARGADCRVVVDCSLPFLASLTPASLDWAYLDSTHSYEDTKAELDLLASRIRPGGTVIGDDWFDDTAHRHAGVARAVREAAASGLWTFPGPQGYRQWVLHRTRD